MPPTGRRRSSRNRPIAQDFLGETDRSWRNSSPQISSKVRFHSGGRLCWYVLAVNPCCLLNPGESLQNAAPLGGEIEATSHLCGGCLAQIFCIYG